MKGTDYIQQFCRYLRSQKGYSANTVLSYQHDLEELHSYAIQMYEMDDLSKVTKTIIRSWMSELRSGGMNPKSVNRKLSALSSFYKYLLRMGVIEQNPAASIRHLKEDKLLPVFVEEDKLKPLLDRNYYPKDFKGATHYLIILFLYMTGVRVSELALLKENELRLSAGIALIHGKGNKQRNVPLSDELISALKGYIAEKKRLFESPDERLIVSMKNRPLSRNSIYKIVRETLGEVTTLSKRSPHVLRHSFATHLSNHGASIGAIKDLLGHASLAATQVYTHTDIARLKEIYDKAHPKS